MNVNNDDTVSNKEWPFGAVGDKHKPCQLHTQRQNSVTTKSPYYCNPNTVSSPWSAAQYATFQDYESQERSKTVVTGRAPAPPEKNAVRPKIEALKAAFRRKNIEIYSDQRLGSGKYSKVYPARDIAEGKMIAIKVIDTKYLSPEVRRKFLPREIECWKELRHKYIVGMTAQYETENMIFLVMEYGNQGDLLSYVQRCGPIAEVRAGRYMAQLLSALGYMHQLKIAHRDIKLENIIMFQNCVKIADFGFVKKVENDELSTTFCGSKAYSAPELLQGSAYDAFKADIWSFGVVGFVMSTDTMPFNENLKNTLIVEHQRNRMYSFSSRLGLSKDCTQSIEAMMTFDPERRPSTEACMHLPWLKPHFKPARSTYQHE